MKTVINDLKTKGYHIFESVVSKEEIESIKLEAYNIRNYYTEDLVKDRVFYKREDSHNRQGDAVMVCDKDISIGDLNYFKIDSDLTITKYYNLYNNIITESVGKEMKKEHSRTMLNIQEYFKGSLPVYNHYDGEFLEYHHEPDVLTNELVLKIDKAILPRFVMVIVLENENDGDGVYIQHHDSTERIPVKLYPGDILIFDNISMRHGVPELENPRMMIGFRNFDYYPVYFEAKPEGGNNWIELPDTLNPGWVFDLTPQESIEVQNKFNKVWKEKGYNENEKPAF